MKENNNISNYQQLLAITSAIILAGIGANCYSSGVGGSNVIYARCIAKELLDGILNYQNKENG